MMKPMAQRERVSESRIRTSTDPPEQTIFNKPDYILKILSIIEKETLGPKAIGKKLEMEYAEIYLILKGLFASGWVNSMRPNETCPTCQQVIRQAGYTITPRGKMVLESLRKVESFEKSSASARGT